jgi:hypothetical protein
LSGGVETRLGGCIASPVNYRRRRDRVRLAICTQVVDFEENRNKIYSKERNEIKDHKI